MTDLKIQLNTGEGISEFTTKKITGRLKSLIMNTSKDRVVNILIMSELGYVIFDAKNKVGQINFLIRPPSHSIAGNEYTDHVCKFSLDEKIIIRIEGGKNINVDLIVRYE